MVYTGWQKLETSIFRRQLLYTGWQHCVPGIHQHAEESMPKSSIGLARPEHACCTLSIVFHAWIVDTQIVLGCQHDAGLKEPCCVLSASFSMPGAGWAWIVDTRDTPGCQRMVESSTESHHDSCL